MQMMNLFIDIGNTNTSLAVAGGAGKITKRYFIHTAKDEVSRKAVKRLLGRHAASVGRVIIVSVVPRFLKIIEKNVKAVIPKAKVVVVGRDIKVPIKNNYTKPLEVGQDRLVTAFAAKKLYGSPVLSIDFGTAVTFDYVNAKGEYGGGLIFPGIRLALSSLVSNTALLPRVDIRPTKGFIGKETVASINNGTLYGYAAMCDGLIEMFRRKYPASLKVVATGGDAALVARYSRHINKVHPGLIFEGLRLIEFS